MSSSMQAQEPLGQDGLVRGKFRALRMASKMREELSRIKKAHARLPAASHSCRLRVGHAIGRAVYQGGDLIFADLQRRLLDRPELFGFLDGFGQMAGPIRGQTAHMEVQGQNADEAVNNIDRNDNDIINGEREECFPHPLENLDEDVDDSDDEEEDPAASAQTGLQSHRPDLDLEDDIWYDMSDSELHPLMGNIFLGTKEQAADRNFMAVQNVQVVASCNLRARRAQIIRGTWNFVHFFIRMADGSVGDFADFFHQFFQWYLLSATTGSKFLIVPDSACSVALAAALLMELYHLSYSEAMSQVQAFPGVPTLPSRFTSLLANWTPMRKQTGPQAFLITQRADFTVPVKWAASLAASMLHDALVFILQNGAEQFVWKGRRALRSEVCSAMEFASGFHLQHGKQAPRLVQQGEEPPSFRRLLGMQ